MKLNVKKTMLTLLVASTLSLTRSGVSGKIGMVDKGDYVKSKTLLNIRIENSLDSEVIGRINEGDLAFRILSVDDNWDLINYNGMIGYAKSEYLEEVGEIIDSTVHYKLDDLIKTDSKVNFRLEPSLDGKRIKSIEKGELMTIIAKTDNDWYLVEYNGTIGYVKGEYVDSLLLEVDKKYPDLALDGINILKVVYANSILNIRSGESLDYDKIGSLKKHETVMVLKEYNDWYLIVNSDGLIGFVAKEYTKELKGIFVVIDLSLQKIYLYDGNKLLLTSNTVTGKNSTPTYVGIFNIDAKERNRYLVGEDYKSFVKYWMPFDGGIGLHDASWRSKFGENIYINNGSHGCVNLPEEVAEEIYKKVKVGTKVIVQK